MNAPASPASLVKVRQLEKTYRRGSERIAVLHGSLSSGLAVEQALDVSEHGLEHRAVVRTEALRLLEFLVEVAQGPCQVGHEFPGRIARRFTV